MSRNVGERHVPDTPVNRKFNATDAVMKMALHTVKICENSNIFIPAFEDVTKQIVQTAIDAYITANDANNITVRKGERDYEKHASMRLEKEEESIELCSRLLGYITMAKRLFHLRKKKVAYWTKLTVEARSYLHKWREAEIDRFKN